MVFNTFFLKYSSSKTKNYSFCLRQTFLFIDISNSCYASFNNLEGFVERIREDCEILLLISEAFKVWAVYICNALYNKLSNFLNLKVPEGSYVQN